MKHPGMTEAIEAAGNVVGYAVAYMRLEHGWTMERAVTTPVRVRGPRRSWTEKRAANKAARDARIAARQQRAPTGALRQKRGPQQVEDSAPYLIQRIRSAYCNEFIKTGVLNEALGKQLREYANAKRASAKHSARVPPEHEVRRYGRETARVGDLGDGGSDRVDEATARSIARYLRPE